MEPQFLKFSFSSMYILGFEKKNIWSGADCSWSTLNV
jgi:hypothetical protein